MLGEPGTRIERRRPSLLIARAWLAHLLGCPLSDLHRVGLVERSRDGTSKTLSRGGEQTVRISIGLALRTLLGEDRRLVMARWGETKRRTTDIGADARVLW